MQRQILYAVLITKSNLRYHFAYALGNPTMFHNQTCSHHPSTLIRHGYIAIGDLSDKRSIWLVQHDMEVFNRMHAL